MKQSIDFSMRILLKIKGVSLMSYKLNLDWDAFLKQYWGKKPVVIREGFSNFIDPISMDELAGLAMEDEVESRIVTHEDNIWDAKFGPFESYDDLDDKNWCLLIQASNHWNEQCAELMAPFEKMPHWSFDDLMAFCASKNGSVGPHIDNYDVFIIQGQGQYHWKIGDRDPNYKEFSAHPALLHVEPYEPILDVILNPGDILYLPIGYPHYGISLNETLSYSVGFRTPTTQELLTGFADYVIDTIPKGLFYQDIDLALPEKPYELQNYEIKGMQKQMISIIEDPTHFNDYLGRKLSEPKHELDLLEINPDYTIDEIQKELKDGAVLVRTLGLKILKIGKTGYVNGESIMLPEAIIDYLCANKKLSFDALISLNEEQWNILSYFVNKGFWYFS